MNKIFAVMMMIGSALAVSDVSANVRVLEVVTVDVVQGAQNLGLDLPISTRSDVSGVCKLLGYDSGIDGTKLAVTETQTRKARHTRWDFGGVMSAYTVEVATKAESFVVDANGTIVKQVYSRQLLSLKCLKQVPSQR